MIVLLASDQDMAAMNIYSRLLEMAQWEEVAKFHDHPVLKLGTTLLFKTSRKMLDYDGFDADIVSSGLVADPEAFIILSRHASESGKATLTAHPIGNYNDAQYGGRQKTLVPVAPRLMTEAIRRLKANASDAKLEGFDISFEATHHGPFVECPVMFIEIGSEASKWCQEAPGRVAARTVLDLLEATAPAQPYPVAIGMGGGHYAPRITDVALGYKISFGHIIPNHALGSDEVVDMALRWTPGASVVYFHKKAMKGAQYRHFKDLFVARGIRAVDSEDLERL